MSPEKTRTLKVGQRVRWTGPPPLIHGTVNEVGYNGAVIKWDDGLYLSLNFAEINEVERVAATKHATKVRMPE